MVICLKVFGGSNDNSNNGGSGGMGSNRNRNSNPNLNLGTGNSSRGNGRNNSSGLGGPSKLSFRGGRGGGEGGHIRGARGGGFNRDRLAPRGWSPSQRSDYSSRLEIFFIHFIFTEMLLLLLQCSVRIFVLLKANLSF